MTEPINIIFLDVDGVLNSLPYCQTAPIGSYVDISEDNLRDLAVLYWKRRRRSFCLQPGGN